MIWETLARGVLWEKPEVQTSISFVCVCTGLRRWSCVAYIVLIHEVDVH